MKTTHFVCISLTAMAFFAWTSATLAGAGGPQGERESAETLVETVRRVTQHFHNVQEAIAAGYTSAGVCVSGLDEGAMGVHFGNGELFDGELNAEEPEILVYEPKNGQFRLVAVEYVVFADAWDPNNQGSPSLLGQLFHYNGSPNRFRSGPAYELHVWAWKENPNGMFADWNPRVSCAGYVP
jgi:hypothetical protein